MALVSTTEDTDSIVVPEWDGRTLWVNHNGVSIGRQGSFGSEVRDADGTLVWFENGTVTSTNDAFRAALYTHHQVVLPPSS